MNSKGISLHLLDEPAAAASLRLSTRTLQRERHKGRIAFYRVGIKVYYTEEQIRDYLDTYCVSVVRTRHKPPEVSETLAVDMTQ